MMQEVNVEQTNELRTIEIGQAILDESSKDISTVSSTTEKTVVEHHSNFGPDMSGSDDDEASEVDSFILDENDIEDSEPGLEASKYLLATEADSQGIQTVDPQTQARLEALLEAAGISRLSSKDGKALSDPEVLRTLTSSVSSALDEAAQALHRMRDSQGQPMINEGVPVETSGESESICHRSTSGNAADASEEGESLLSLACSAGYYELAQVLLAMKANVEDRGIKGDCTPLMEAASGGHVDIVRLLLLHNADINAQSSAGNTPLHYGACGGFKEVVEELINHGANVEIHNENGHTPLMEAASAGHVDVAKILLEHGAGINTHSNEFKESALTLACYKGHLDMVKFLLEAGADQEHKTDEMHTALMEASMDGHVEVARLLLDSGAQVNMPEDSFESPLTLAACGGHLELATLLIERGANIEEVNDEGYTPLMEAAREGHEDMVALLLSQGADINAQTEETQETALTLACCGGFLEVADFLLRSGALIELGCSTPLMEAAQEGHIELVSFLLQTGANVEAQTGTGDTALTYACENGHTDVAEALLDHGAKLEHESEGGRTPLMKAARAGHLCTVQYLITKAGADVNRATTSNDHTVLSLACAGGHMNVVDMLLTHSSDPNHKLKDGSTMVIEAAKGGHTQVVKLLLEWPNRFSMAQEQVSQLNAADIPIEEPRVPVQGLANIVPPSDPDSKNPVTVADVVNAKKSMTKRTVIGQTDGKNNKLTNTSAENFQLINAAGLIDDKAIVNIEKDEKLTTNQTTKEEQIFQKQQILEELKKVEQELKEKAAQQQLNAHTDLEQQQQMQAKLKQPIVSPSNPSQSNTAVGLAHKPEFNEELAKLFDLPSQTDTMDQINDFAKLVCDLGPGSSPNTEAYFQQSPLILPQHSNPVQPIHCIAPPPPPSNSVVSSSNCNNSGESRGGSGKTQSTKRNGPKQGRSQKNLPQALDKPPPPPPPPPPPQCNLHPAKGPRLLPQQQILSQAAQPIVFQTEHTGASQSVEACQNPAPTTQVLLDPAQHQQLQALKQQMQQQQQQQLLLQSCAPVINPGQAQHEQLLQQMLSQQPSLQHQIQMQQLQQNQHVLQAVASTQVSTAPPTHLSPQQQQQYQFQQQQAQLLQQHLQQLKSPATNAIQTVALNKPQVVRKQQRQVQPAAQIPVNHNPVTNVEDNPPPTSVPQATVPAASLAAQLNSNVDVDSQTESNHDTALTLACTGGHAELVSLLLAKGADIEHRDKKGFTPLILAATGGHVDVVEILLDHSADIEAQSERTKDTPLSLACSGGRYEVVELLLTRQANKEHRNVSDYTPLSLAASGGYVNIIKLLLSHNAEINSRTGSKLGISPLMLAAMNGHTAAVKLLLDMGSDINAQIETNRNTALTLACFQGRHEVVSLLVDRKANIEHRAKTGLTPLMEAASGGYVEVGRVLLDKGADVNAPPVPSSRDTALTIAADKGHYRFVELLLHRGASVDVKNKKGNSPLWLACNGGHSDVVSLLVQADADIDSQDNRKVSCLMAAFRRGHIKVVKWMVKKVTQFPSEHEIKRYITTVTDKELQKKCNQCADVIVSAKDRQAAEANKNADSLLEEIKQEKEQAALKAEMASKRRERRRERKKKGKQKEEKGDKDSGKNSSPEPDCEFGFEKKDDEDEDDDEDDDKEDLPVNSATVPGKTEVPGRVSKGKSSVGNSGKNQTVIENHSSRLPLNMVQNVNTSSSSAFLSSTTGISSNTSASASARANREARKKQQKAARENRRETSGNDSGLRHNQRVVDMNKKQVSEALQVTLAKVTTIMSSVVTMTAISSPANSSNTLVVSSTVGSGTHSVHIPRLSNMSTNAVSHSLYNVKENSSTVNINGTGNKSRSKKSNDIKQNTAPGVTDLDDFGISMSNNVLKNFTNGKLKKSSDNKKDVWTIEDYNYKVLEKSSNRMTSTAPSPRKGQKKDEGWKEVVRKNVSKKLLVPANVTARLIGKGGCNINAIREISGAHVEVEKAKGNSDRTVTIKGCPEAIKQANNLINSMVEEPDKDISEILVRVTNKSHKSVQEKPQPQKAPVSIANFDIGTFTVPTTSSNSNSSSSSGKSPAQNKSRQGGSQSNSSRSAPQSSNVMSGTIGAWQNPVPGQVTPSSPRRSPQKQITPNPTTHGRSVSTNVDKNSARQLIFGEARGSKRASSPVSAASSSAALTFTATATTTIRGVVSSTSVASSPSVKSPDARLQTPSKSSISNSNPVNGGNVRYPRPGNGVSNRLEPMPLPIVTSGSNNHLERSQPISSTSASQPPPHGEYSPFQNNLFPNLLAKKEDQADKMDFASVAAAGVVTTSQSPQTTSNTPSSLSNNAVDAALQAKAPGFKIPQRGIPDQDPSITGYRPMNPGPPGGPAMNAGMAHHFQPLDNYNQMIMRYQQHMPENAFNQLMHPLMRMELGARGMLHPGMLPPGSLGALGMGIGGLGQPPLPQKEEYSKPHRPMTLPKIEGSLNPNAPEFQLTSGGQPIMNGFDPPNSLFNTMMGMAGRSVMSQNGPLDGLSPTTSPNPGSGMPGLQALPQIIQQNPDIIRDPKFQYMLQLTRQTENAQMAMSGGSSNGNGGNSPPQLGSSRLSSSINSGMATSSQGHGSPPQGVIGPPGMNAGSSNGSFLSQSQNQPTRPHSPLLSGRPSSAPSVQPDPGLIGPPRSASPMSSRTPPLEINNKFPVPIQPIGGERKRAVPVRSGPVTNSNVAYGNLWGGYNNPSVPAGNMVFHRGMPEGDNGLDYSVHGPVQYDANGAASGDGDHNNISNRWQTWSQQAEM